MKVLATLQILVTLLTITNAAVESVSGPRELTKKSVITRFQVKLTPANELTPFIGVPNAAGVAQVKLDFRPSRSGAGGKWKVCIETNVIGFTPGLLHIHKGTISENGGVAVDFTTLLSDDPVFDGCVTVTQAVFNDIKLNPDLFYVNAHVAGDPTALFNRAIRGQLRQRLRTTVVPSEEVSPFMGKAGASGIATISFEAAGTVICIDATVKGFHPVLAHLHNAKVGFNGGVVVNFSSMMVAPGRFLGCGTLSELGVTNALVAQTILADPSDFYFNFHLGASGTSDFNVAIRGQL